MNKRAEDGVLTPRQGLKRDKKEENINMMDEMLHK